MNKIIELGNTILRNENLLVKDIENNEIKFVMKLMSETLPHTGGVEVSAPQVGFNYQICYIDCHPTKFYSNIPKFGPIFFVNPKIIKHSVEIEFNYEGCLSLPGVRALVGRYKWIELEYLDAEFNKFDNRLEGFVARVVQHEVDHLNRIIFTDRLDNNKSIITDNELLKLINKTSNG